MQKRVKRWGLWFLTLFCLSVLIGTGGTKAKAKSVHTRYEGTYGYSTLSSKSKIIYGKINEAMLRFHESEKNAAKKGIKENIHYVAETVHLNDHSVTVEELSRIMFAIQADHPAYFWYEGVSYTYSKRGVLVQAPGHKVTSVAIVTSSQYANGKQRKKAVDALAKALLPYTEKIDQMKSSQSKEIELELFLHDQLIKDITYGEEDDPECNTVIGAFVNQSAICEGYAKAFQLLANYAGLVSVYAVGYGYDMGHAWNIVKIDGKWYNVDVTWDDGAEEISYLYFNALDDVFYASHSFSSDFDGVYAVPQRTKSKEYQYYTYFGLSMEKKDLDSKTAFREKAYKAVTAMLEREENLLRFQVEDKYRAKFKKMWSENKEAVAQRLGENGVIYEFDELQLLEDIATVNDKVFGIYLSSIHVIEASVNQSKKYIGEAEYKVYRYSEGQKKTITASTTSTYKNGKLRIYYKDQLLGTYKVEAGKLKVSEIKTYVYTGKEKKPKPEVSFGGDKLVYMKDYTLTYKKNTNAGKAKVIIKGKGIYTGSQEVTFTINKKSIKNCTVSKVGKQSYTGKKIKPKVTVYQKGRKLKKNKDYTVTYSKNKKRGTAYVIIKGKGMNYKSTKKVKFQIV